MLFLHFLWSLKSSFSLIRRQVSKDLKDGIANRVTSMINILFANMLRTKFSSFKLVLTSICKISTIFAIKLICDNSNENFIFHQESTLVFLKGNIEFKSTIMSTPGVITFIAPELKESFFGSLLNLILWTIPLSFIMFEEESRKSFLRCPFDRNPFKLLLRHSWNWLHLYRKFSVNIVLDLFNWRVRLISILLLLGIFIRVGSNRYLKPISYFENVSLLQISILIISDILVFILLWLLPLGLKILPFKDNLVSEIKCGWGFLHFHFLILCLTNKIKL